MHVEVLGEGKDENGMAQAMAERGSQLRFRWRVREGVYRRLGLKSRSSVRSAGRIVVCAFGSILWSRSLMFSGVAMAILS